MTHTYSTDSLERRYIPLFVALVSVAAAFVLFKVLRTYGLEAPWWISPPDTMVFYGLFYLLFDKVVWRWSWIRKLGITKIPDLSGIWQGQVTPNTAAVGAAGVGAPADITITIRQSWSELSIKGRTSNSASEGLSAYMIVSGDCSVSYEYMNEPAASAVGTMHAHRGMAHLSLDSKGTTLQGEYYSGRDRQSFGSIQLTKAEKH